MKKSQFWLMKSEPDVFSIDHLEKKGRTFWDGVRNYQARNFMTQKMNVGDIVLFYHSNANPPGVVGLAKVSTAAVPDPTSWDRKSKDFDPKSTPQSPRWFGVHLDFLEKFDQIISLNELKSKSVLKDMMVVQKGSRLSIQPVDKKHFEIILKLAERQN